MLEVIAAADLLARDWRVESSVFSVTSYTELAREARATERENRLHPRAQAERSHVEQTLSGDVPVVAATDYACALPQMIAAFIEPRLIALGTDGFGRSDTRAALRDFFEVDRYHIAVAALYAFTWARRLDAGVCARAIEKYAIDAERAPSWER